MLQGGCMRFSQKSSGEFFSFLFDSEAWHCGDIWTFGVWVNPCLFGFGLFLMILNLYYFLKKL